MTTHPISRLLAVATLVVLAAAGCSQHEDPAAPLSLIDPPTPTNLSIVDNNDGTYDIFWDITNDGVVKNYRVYSVGFTGLSLEGEPTEREWGIFTVIPVGGVMVGVTAVTQQNVEGAMATIVTPEPQ